MFGEMETSLANQVIGMFGLGPIKWLKNDLTGYFALLLLACWRWTGVNILYFLAGLQSISTDLYEAASIDGASSIQQLFRIVLPLLKPTTWLVFLLQMIACFKVFGQIYMITGGGPASSTRPLIQYIYENAFGKSNMGYAAAMSYVLFGILLILSLAQQILQRKGEE